MNKQADDESTQAAGDETRASEHGADADTTIVEPTATGERKPELAWSVDDDEPEPQQRSWARTAGIAAGITACGTALAAGLLLAIQGFKHDASNTVEPQRTAPTTTVAVAPTTTAPAPTSPHASDAANDQVLLQRLGTDGFMMIKDPQMTLGFAHQVCNSLRQGRSEADVVQWLAAALRMSPDWAALFTNDVKVSYPNCERN